MFGRLLELIEPSDSSFFHRVLHGGFWGGAISLSDRLLQLGKVAVLANLLAPADFGLLGIALLTVEGLRTISKTGFDEALIQREADNVDELLDTAWIIKTARGVAMALVLYAAAPAIAAFFGEPRVELVLRVMGLVIVIEGLANPAVIYFRKDLDFHKQFFYKLSGTVVDVVVAVTTGFLFRNVWALVFGLLAGRVVRTAGSHLFMTYTPGLSFGLSQARNLFGYGRWILASSFMYFIVTMGDDAFIGWFLTASALGLYQVAFRFSNTPATQVTNVISKVLFPAFSKIQNDQRAIRNAYTQTFTFLTILVVPMTTGLILLADDFTTVVLGQQWLPMVPAFQLLAVSGLFRALPGGSGALYRGTGYPQWAFYESVPRFVVLGATLWPFTDRFGITGAALSVTLAVAATLPITIYKTRDIAGIAWSRQWDRFFFPMVATLVMTPIVGLLTAPSVFRLGLAVLAGAVTYFVVLYSLYLVTGRNHLESVISRL